MPHYRITLAKEDFHFSSAHFTIFGPDKGELLHGHNYRVEVEVWGEEIGELGLLVDFDKLKQEIRQACGRLDSRTLVPARSPHLTWQRHGDTVEIRFGARAYQLPATDVVFLPCVNTTVELLAQVLWDELSPGLEGSRVQILGVTVEETAGQSCRYEAPIPS